MDPVDPDDATSAMTHLADQWSILREQYAFLGEALLRLIADHPDLAPDVIQGAIQSVAEARSRALVFHQAFNQLLRPKP